jgi:hypothetical protein
LKPLAAIWHFPDPRSKAVTSYAVAVVGFSAIPGQAFGVGYQAVVVLADRTVRGVHVSELEIVDDAPQAAVGHAQMEIAKREAR